MGHGPDLGEGDVRRGRKMGESARIATGMEHRPDPGEGNVQWGRTGGNTARQARGMGHGLPSLMAARECIGHTLFRQAPPHENLPLPTRPAGELSMSNSFAEVFVDEYSSIWVQAMENELEGLTSAGLSGGGVATKGPERDLSGCSPGRLKIMVTSPGRRRGWWREGSNSVARVLITSRILVRRLRCLVFVCWVLLRASSGWIYVILMPNERSSSRLWIKSMLLCGCLRAAGKCLVNSAVEPWSF